MTQEKYYFLPNSNLPKFGWLQSCVNCSTITSRITLIKHAENTDYYVYLCNPCKRKNFYNTSKFLRLIEKKITPISLDPNNL